MSLQYKWWQTRVVYQIYPRSFQDSNGDGIGDLPGITRRLDYLADLGIDAIWISPMYPSPMADFGYDVSDYVGVHPMFGTMADFDHLLAEAHRRDIKLILDFVPNHSSDQHPWFQESRSSRDNAKRDWYIWRDPAPGGGPPTNWVSIFGGSAWTFDERRGQYYMHQYLKEQPDLNYHCPEVLPAMLDAMRFWLDKGVDGFRFDAVQSVGKDPRFLDEPVDPDWDGVNPFWRLKHIYTRNQPQIHTIIAAMRKLVDQYPERVTIGELHVPLLDLMEHYGKNLDEFHLPFNFNLLRLPWDAPTVRKLAADYEAALPRGAWPNWVLGNHDRPRVATRVGAAQARVAQMFLLTMRGSPTCYYGDEIGMENVPIPPEYVQDPPALLQPEIAHILGRDPERTPMQWDTSANAGFSPAGVRTWLPLAADYKQRNVAAQANDPMSMLSLFRALLGLRRAEASLTVGDYTCVDAGVAEVFAYLRAAPGAPRFLIVLNFSGQDRRLNLSSVAASAAIVLSTGMARAGQVDLGRLDLAGNEGLVLRL